MVSSKKKGAPEIKVRKPGKIKPDTFANIRQLPHPVEEILGFLPSSERESEEQDHRSTAVPQYRSTAVSKKPKVTEILNKTESSLQDQTQQITAVPQYRSTAVGPQKEFYRKPNEHSDRIDRTLTSAESRIYDHIYRLTVGFNQKTCRVTVRELMNRTGYRSDKTVRIALSGLETKRKIRRLEQVNSPLGDLYEILLSEELGSGTAVPEYRGEKYSGTAAENTGHLNTIKNNKKPDDDGRLVSDPIMTVAVQIGGEAAMTGERWADVGKLLAEELATAAARTPQVNNVAAFFHEHLRRALGRAGKSKVEIVKKESKPRSGQTKVERLKKIINETRGLHVGDGSYSEDDLIADVIFKAKRGGIECDENLINSLLTINT